MINELESVYTDQELAEAYVFPVKLTPEEQAEADAELRAYRLERERTMTEEDKLMVKIMYLRANLENLLKQEQPAEFKEFNQFLALYIKTLGKKQVDFAAEISLHPTKLNQILKNRVMPNLALMYRLEKHSGGLIPALVWWKLVAKKIEHEIENDTEKRAKEARKVHFELAIP